MTDLEASVPTRAPAEGGGACLAVRGLRKSYGDHVALDGVDLDIRPGEVLALLGPNGAGKTTFLSIVAGLRRPDAGSVTVAGIDAASRPDDARRFIGMAPQDIGVYPSLTVRENLAYAAKLADPRQPDADGRISEVIDSLSLEPMATKQVQHLSGGEKRRVHVGMALVHRPALVMLDEPTAGVDIETRAAMLDIVRRLAATGTAVCYSTHYMPEVEQLDASVAMIDHGRIVALGTVRELVNAHAQGALRLTFEGRAPELDLPYPVEVSDGELVVRADEPSPALAVVLGRIGAHVDMLRSIEIIQPSLEMAFLALTGRRYQPEGTEDVDRP